MRVIFGGTFDPVHIGHLRMANELATALSVAEVSLMPCYQAVHKQGVGASSQHRLNMLALAAERDSAIILDDRENRRTKESYTINSLRELRQEYGSESLCLAMGTDSAQTLPSWFQVEAFSKLAHIIVISRPGTQYSQAAEHALVSQLETLGFIQTESLNELKEIPAGKFMLVKLSALDISSTYIRNRIKQGLSIRYLVTDAVRDYICDNALYQN